MNESLEKAFAWMAYHKEGSISVTLNNEQSIAALHLLDVAAKSDAEIDSEEWVDTICERANSFMETL